MSGEEGIEGNRRVDGWAHQLLGGEGGGCDDGGACGGAIVAALGRWWMAGFLLCLLDSLQWL